ncbi:hypothetical protein EON66_01450 [archaeon]|nr:MAG: hypothetical protein EON66_01450 [archaeon]
MLLHCAATLFLAAALAFGIASLLVHTWTDSDGGNTSYIGLWKYCLRDAIVNGFRIDDRCGHGTRPPPSAAAARSAFGTHTQHSQYAHTS